MMSSQLLSAVAQADRDREIAEATRRALLLPRAPHPSVMERLRSQFSRSQRRSSATGLASYREVGP
jgi:hypothetical protein